MPIWFVTPRPTRRARGARRGGAALCRDREVRTQGGASRCSCRDRTARWAACCSALRAPTSPRRTLFPPGAARPVARRQLPLRQCAARRALARLPSRSAATFTRYRKAEATARSSIPGASTATNSRIAEGVALARDLINTPANDLGRRNWKRRRALARHATAPVPLDRRRRSAQGELPADPRGRPRLRARAAADRYGLGRRGRARRSRWSARACASTPAASTSSRTPAC